MPLDFRHRLRIVKIFILVIGVIFGARLFTLQVLSYDRYHEEARFQHEKRSVLPARRGKILVKKDRLSDELTPLATNNTLKMLYLDPLVLRYPKYDPRIPLAEQEPGNPEQAARLLAPILIHAHCEKIEGCEIETEPDNWSVAERIAIEAYTEELVALFTKIDRTRVQLATDLTDVEAEQVEVSRIDGIWREGNSAWADPTRIIDRAAVADQIAPIIKRKRSTVEALLERRPRRYVEVTDKIVPEVSDAINDLKNNEKYYWLLRGIGLKDEHWRYYPERELASAVLGFVDNQGRGQYGIEGRFDHEIKGKEGYIYGATTAGGDRRLQGADITRAQDGADIVLTIDRRIQGVVESILSEHTERFQADSGQVIVIEPETGKILALAQAPTFDPNEYGEVFQRYEITEEQEALDRADENFNRRIPTEEIDNKFYRYFNTWGPQVFRNRVVSDLYEPGSVMKAVTMAIALNVNEVTPEMTFDDVGPIEVDEFKIRNSDSYYAGPTSMISVLNRSLNTGIAFITRKMGPKLLYEEMTKFGFGQFTDIEIDGEAQGELEPWQYWVESELITRGFGQGVSSTPLQMAMAFNALANGGYVMKPLIVEEVRYADGRAPKTYHPEVVERVISDETYSQIKSMLLQGVTRGVANNAQVPGYSVMGKTGTSQTYRHGRALEGLGTTIASFAGFGPIKEPRFVVLVKYDYPKTSQWGSETAAVTFQEVAEFLFDHFQVPPDKL